MISFYFPLSAKFFNDNLIMVVTSMLLRFVQSKDQSISWRSESARLLTIFTVFAKHGLGYYLQKFPFNPLKNLGSSSESLDKKTLGARLRLAFEELGPTFIKLGQLLATRKDVVPLTIAEELKELRHNNPAVPWDNINTILQNELGQGYQDFSFEETPIAVGSIAQVHRAFFLKKRVHVVFKILKPNIEKQIMLDIRILYRIAKTMEERDIGSIYSPVALVQELDKLLAREINLSLEANHLKYFKKAMISSRLLIPEYYPEYSTRKVLCEEEIQGKHLGLIDQIEDSDLAIELSNFFLNQLVMYGVFHSDLHPSNLILTEGLPRRLGIVDFGQVMYLSSQTIEHLYFLLQAISTDDLILVMESLRNLNMIHHDSDEKQLEIDLRNLFYENYDKSIRELQPKDLFDNLFKILYKNRVYGNMELVILFKALLQLDEVINILSTNVKPLVILQDYLNQNTEEFVTPQKVKSRLKFAMSSMTTLGYDLPSLLLRVLRKADQGNLVVKFIEHEQQKQNIELRRNFNTLSASILSASFLIAGALTWPNPQPRIHDFGLVSMFFFFGFLVSSWWLLYSIWRTWRI